MQIETAFTPQSLDEANALNRRWYHWPLFVVRNANGMVIYVALLLVAAGTIVKDVRSPTHSPASLAEGVLGLCALIGYPLWLYRRERRKVRTALGRQGSLIFLFTDEGITIREQNGVTTSVPWSLYSGFREGKQIFMLRQIEPVGYRAIPKDPGTAESIRSLLLARLPRLS